MTLYNSRRIHGLVTYMENNKERITKAVFYIACIVASITKIFIGIDYDEGSTTTACMRLFQGDLFLRENWGGGQFAMFPACLLIEFYKLLTGGIEGIFFFLRVVSTLLQAGVTVFFFNTFKRSFNHCWIASIAVFVMLPRATQNFEYGIQAMLLLIIMICILYRTFSRDFYISSRYSCYFIILAALFYSWAILSYPGFIFTAPFLLISIWNIFPTESRLKVEIVFWSTCLFLAVILVSLVLTYMPIEELLDNLHWIMSEGSHSNSGRLISLMKGTFTGKNLLFIIVTILCGIIYKVFVYLFLHKNVSVVNGAMLGTSVIIIGLNLSGIRISGPFGFLIRLLVISILGLKLVKGNKFLFWIFYFFGISTMLGPAIVSNLGIGENAGFSEITILGILLVLAEKYNEVFVRIPVLLFLVSLIFYKGVLVRINKTEPANIFEKRVQITSGPYKFLTVYPDEASDYYAKIEDLKSHLDETDTVIYLGSDMIMQTVHGGRFSTPTGTDTPVFDEQWVVYYRDKAYVIPDVYIIDKESIENMERFIETDFGQYLNQCDIVVIDETDNFIYFCISPKNRF